MRRAWVSGRSTVTRNGVPDEMGFDFVQAACLPIRFGPNQFFDHLVKDDEGRVQEHGETALLE